MIPPFILAEPIPFILSNDPMLMIRFSSIYFRQLSSLGWTMALLVSFNQVGCRGIDQQTPIDISLHRTLEAQSQVIGEATKYNLAYIQRSVEQIPEEKAKHLLQKAELLMAESDSIREQIKVLQRKLTKESGGVSEAGQYQNPTEKARVAEILFDGKEVEKLTKGIERFVQRVEEVGGRGFYSTTLKGKLLTIPPHQYSNYLKDANLAAALAMLSAIEVDKLHYFDNTLSECRNQLSRKKEEKNPKRLFTCFLITAQKDKLNTGEMYEAEVALVKRLVNTTFLKEARVNGKK
jgi:hypothetical protein